MMQCVTNNSMCSKQFNVLQKMAYVANDVMCCNVLKCIALLLYFQNVVKMECRAKTRPPLTTKNSVGGSYFGQFKEKKCFCARGFYPRGPICTS